MTKTSIPIVVFLATVAARVAPLAGQMPLPILSPSRARTEECVPSSAPPMACSAIGSLWMASRCWRPRRRDRGGRSGAWPGGNSRLCGLPQGG